MVVSDAFNEIAKEYDSKRRLFIPCYDEFYSGATAFITKNIKSPKNILDIGSGTGLLASFWRDIFPNSAYILLDAASDMLDVARKRFSGAANVTYEVGDYRKGLPRGTFDAVISALSIHHLDDGDKCALFKRVYSALCNGGVFVNYDQFCGGNKTIDTWYTKCWEEFIKNGGLTDNDIDKWRKRQTLDRECSTESQVALLRESGFNSCECVYQNQKFAVIVALKGVIYE